MTSFQITLKPSRRTAGRFVAEVRRTLQKALAEENQRTGLTQSDIARTIVVHRSVISRELRGYKDITLGRVAELAFAMGRKPSLVLLTPHEQTGTNNPIMSTTQTNLTASVAPPPGQFNKFL